jgi:hypothetical protein
VRASSPAALKGLWAAGRLSASDYLIRLNALHGRNFLTDPPLFPGGDALAYFIGPRAAMLRADLEHSPDAVSAFARSQFGVSGDRPRDRLLHVGDIDCWHVCQRLSLTVGARRSFLFQDDSLIIISGRGERLPGPADTAVILQRERTTLLITNHRTYQICARVVDPALAFAKGLAVGETGLFAVVDLETGVSVAYRVGYGAREIARMGEFASPAIPQSVVSDRDFSARPPAAASWRCGRRQTDASTASSSLRAA